MLHYHQDLAVFGDEVPGEIGDGELNPPGADGHQEVVVNEVIPAEGDEEERLVHKHGRLLASDQAAHSLLVLLEQLKLLRDSYYVCLRRKKQQKLHICSVYNDPCQVFA